MRIRNISLSIFTALAACSLSSCSNVDVKLAENTEIVGLATPISVYGDTTKVVLSDYFNDVTSIENVNAKEDYKTVLNKDNNELILISNKKTPLISSVEFTVKGFSYFIPTRNAAFKTTVKKAPILSTFKYDEKSVSIEAANDVKGFIAYYQNYRLPENFIQKNGNIYTITIPANSLNKDRAYIRAYAYNEDGISNDIFVPLTKGKVLAEVKDLSRKDIRTNILYFMLNDRFCNGRKDNDHPLKSKKVLPMADYMGGDIAGILKQLKEGYFEKLGINTLWLSPIAQNPIGAFGYNKDPETEFSGYHGYWPESSSKVDFRFGTSKELKELVAEAHKRDINVILDYVANHVHQNHPIYKQHPEWATKLHLEDGTLNIEKWDEHRLTTWFDTFLPTLDLARKEVYEPMTDSAMFWLKEYKLDGFRHDATKHIPEIFWRTLTKKIKKQVLIPNNTSIYQVGETYGNRALIGSYVGSGMIDGQFDFNVYDDAVGTFAIDKEKFSRLSNSLQSSLNQYGYHNKMSYISGNHDRARFISYASGKLKFSEDVKYVAWHRHIVITEKQSYQKLDMLNAFNMTIPGVPCIYYGDEIGLGGAGDPDSRRMMKFDNLTPFQANTREVSSKLCNLRKSYMPLMYGDFRFINVENADMAYIRTYFNEFAIVVFNKSKNKSVSVNLPARFKNTNSKAQFGHKFDITGTSLKVELEANEFEIITGEFK